MRKNLMVWEIENDYKSNYVAERLGISHSVWSNIKRGRSNPTYKLLQKFQKQFKPVDIITLFAEETTHELQ